MKELNENLDAIKERLRSVEHAEEEKPVFEMPKEFEDRIDAIEARINGLERAFKNALPSLTTGIEELRKKWATKLPEYEKALSERFDKLEVSLKFLETEQTVIIWGFIPKKKADNMISILSVAAKNKVIIEKFDIEKDDKVPTAFDNPSPIDSFQFFLDVYAIPKYKTIDPTWFISFTFPFLFGFMLGDIGYGITTLIVVWILKKNMPRFSKFLNIILISSAATILFGLVFGEFFGAEIYPGLISRNPEHKIETLLITSLVIGVIHLNSGLISGFKNELAEHGFKEAFYKKFGWIFLEIAAALLGISYSKLLPLPHFIGYAVLIASILIIFKGERIEGLIEIPTIFANILSYARLMAIGLSSVGLALIVNEFTGQMFKNGGIFIIVGVLILVIGHFINLFIGIFDSFLQSLRLHYVELFSKFYKGGGILYKPFGRIDGGE